jgi:sRNA-binding carbon storage regulator CsrA
MQEEFAMLTVMVNSGEYIMIGDYIEIVATHSGNSKISVDVQAPSELKILRREVDEQDLHLFIKMKKIDRGEYITIGDDIKVFVYHDGNTRIKVSIQAPNELRIVRQEARERKSAESATNAA